MPLSKVKPCYLLVMVLISMSTPLLGSDYERIIQRAVIGCILVFYRKHYVSSKALSPTWQTFSAEKLTEQQLHFSLQLMTGLKKLKQARLVANMWLTPRQYRMHSFLQKVRLVECVEGWLWCRC